MVLEREKEIDLSEFSEKEQRILERPSYSRDGVIPGWTEVIGKFGLNKLHPRDFRLIRGYYRAQRRLAEGRPKKASRIFRALDENQDFQTLEKGQASLLSNIALFVRGPSEKRRLK